MVSVACHVDGLREIAARAGDRLPLPLTFTYRAYSAEEHCENSHSYAEKSPSDQTFLQSVLHRPQNAEPAPCDNHRQKEEFEVDKVSLQHVDFAGRKLG